MYKIVATVRIITSGVKIGKTSAIKFLLKYFLSFEKKNQEKTRILVFDGTESMASQNCTFYWIFTFCSLTRDGPMNIYTILVHGFSNCSAINIEKTRHQVLRTIEPKPKEQK